jgi:hypothetical protein
LLKYSYSLEEHDGLSVVSYAVLFPAPLDELLELGVAGEGVSLYHPTQRVTHAEDPFPDAKAGYTGRKHGTRIDDLGQICWGKRIVAYKGIAAREAGRAVGFHAPHNGLPGV